MIAAAEMGLRQGVIPEMRASRVMKLEGGDRILIINGDSSTYATIRDGAQKEQYKIAHPSNPQR